MINYEYESLFRADSVKRSVKIVAHSYGSNTALVTLTNADIVQGSLALKDSLCADNVLTFGSISGAEFSFVTTNISPSYNGLILEISVTPEGGTELDLPYIFVVDTETLSADRNRKSIHATDLVAYLHNQDVASWYNSLIFPMTLKQFRDNFFTNVSLDVNGTNVSISQSTITLVNDNMQVEQTIQPTNITAGEVLKSICEINGCFGHFKGYEFNYIVLEKFSGGLYPAIDLYPAEDLYPDDPGEGSAGEEVTVEIGEHGNYKKATFSDYYCLPVTKLQIRQETDDIGVIVGTDGNTYIVQGNFLVYGKGVADLTIIASALLGAIAGYTYVPCNIQRKGNPCMEVGDPFKMQTKNGIIVSYILERTLNGSQFLNDNYVAKGEEYYSEQNVGYHHDILQLRNKSNIIERDLDETKSTITDEILDPNNPQSLQSQITQNATEISAKVSETDHNASNTFGWELKTTGFDVKANGNTVFKVDSTGAEVKGNIKAETGYIGNGTQGFEIGNTDIHTNNFSTATEGVQLSTNGLHIKGQNISGDDTEVEIDNYGSQLTIKNYNIELDLSNFNYVFRPLEVRVANGYMGYDASGMLMLTSDDPEDPWSIILEPPGYASGYFRHQLVIYADWGSSDSGRLSLSGGANGGYINNVHPNELVIAQEFYSSLTNITSNGNTTIYVPVTVPAGYKFLGLGAVRMSYDANAYGTSGCYPYEYYYDSANTRVYCQVHNIYNWQNQKAKVCATVFFTADFSNIP